MKSKILTFVFRESGCILVGKGTVFSDKGDTFRAFNHFVPLDMDLGESADIIKTHVEVFDGDVKLATGQFVTRSEIGSNKWAVLWGRSKVGILMDAPSPSGLCGKFNFLELCRAVYGRYDIEVVDKTDGAASETEFTITISPQGSAIGFLFDVARSCGFKLSDDEEGRLVISASQN